MQHRIPHIFVAHLICKHTFLHSYILKTNKGFVIRLCQLDIYILVGMVVSTLCHVVNFVFTPTQKIQNLQHDNLARQHLFSHKMIREDGGYIFFNDFVLNINIFTKPSTRQDSIQTCRMQHTCIYHNVISDY